MSILGCIAMNEDSKQNCIGECTSKAMVTSEK